VNRDYTSGEPGDWKVTQVPDGRLRLGMTNHSDQDGEAIYSDRGHPSPRGIIVTQKSWAWREAPYNDFVILQYIIENKSNSPLNEIYVGQFMDFDVKAGNKNEVMSDSVERAIYQWKDSSSICVGVKLLDPTKCANLSGIEYNTYVNRYIEDSIKIKFLNGKLSFPTSDTFGDWAVIVSAGPFNILPQDTIKVAFAILGGDNISDIKDNADKAQQKYDSIMGEEERREDERKAITYEYFRIHPNPFIYKTIIEVRVYSTHPVQMQIYDLAGRLVKSFPPFKSKTKEIWDGKDNYNKELPSGVYFCRIKNNEFNKIKKFILIRE
jgi:hypothetical protein